MRLIDADALLEKEGATGYVVVGRRCGKTLRDTCRNYLHICLSSAPTIDAVPVVRCKECEYWNKRYEAMGMCMKHNAIVTFTKPDFYCAWGERKQK